MEKKFILGLVLLVVLILTGSAVFAAKVWVKGAGHGNVTSLPYNYTSDTTTNGGSSNTRVRVMGLKIWASAASEKLATLNLTVFNIHNFATTDLATLGTDYTSGVSVIYDSNADGTIDGVAPLSVSPGWTTVGSSNYVGFTFGSAIEALPTSEPANFNYYIQFNASLNPTNGSYFNFTLETMDSPITTNNNATAGAILNATIGSSNLTFDSVLPTILVSQTKDSDKNGYVDAIIVNFGEIINDNTFNSTGCFRVNNTAGGEVGDVAVSTGETGNDTILYINWTTSQIQYTNVTPIYNYTQNASCQLKDLAGNLLASNGNIPTVDGAPPAFWGCNAYDNDADGRLNNMNCTLSENITSTSSVNTNNFTAYVNYGANTENSALTITAIVNKTKGSEQNNISIIFNDAVIGTGNASLRYTGNGLLDIKGNSTVTNNTNTVTDSAGPFWVDIFTIDNNTNGFIESAKLKFSENLSETETSLNQTTIGCFKVNALDGTDAITGNVTFTINDNLFYLNYSQKQYTNTTPIFNYTNNVTCGIKDAAGNLMPSLANLTSLDDAAPVFFTATSYDSDFNGELDRIEINMSENITASSSLKVPTIWSPYVNFGAPGDNKQLSTGVTASAGSSSGGLKNNITITINQAANTVKGTGNVSVVYSGYSDGINDTRGNLSIVNTSIRVTDTAVPVIIYEGTIDQNKNGYLDAIQINFSEGISNNTVGTNSYTFNQSHNFSIGLLGSNLSNGTNGVGDICGLTESLCIPPSLITVDHDADLNGAGGANDSVIFLNITTSKYNFTTGQVANVSFVPNGTSLVQDLVGLSLRQNNTPENATDAAPPVFWAGHADDLGKNGALDFINLSLSESLTPGANVKGTWSATVNYGPGTRTLTISSVTANTGAGNLTLQLNNAIFGTGAVTLSYTSAAGGVNDTGSNLVATNASITVRDNASAVVFKEETWDNNTNGYLDAIHVNFSEPVLDSSFADDADNITVGSIARQSLTFNTHTTANDGEIVLYFNGTTTYNTGNTPNVNFSINTNNVTSNMTDLAGINITSNTTVELSTDTAPPVFWTGYTEDLGKNGAMDFINLSLSEALSEGPISKGTWSANVSYGPGTRPLTISSATAAGSNVTLQLNNAVFGTGAVTLSYITATGGINDSVGNLIALNASIATRDNASAVVFKEETMDNNTNGYLDAIIINFSESVQDSSFADAADNITVGSIARQSLTFNTGETANNEQIILYFNGTTTYNTGNTPSVNFSIGSNNVTSNMTDTSGLNITSNTSVELSTDKAAPVIWSKGTLSANRTGYLDTINITFSESVVDNRTVNLSVEGISAINYYNTSTGAFPGDSENDAYVFLGFTGTTYFTNGTPTVNYSYGGASGTSDVLKDSSGNKVVRNDTANGAAATDTAPPVLLSAVASDGATASNGVDSDDYIMFTFSEQVNFTKNRRISNTTVNSTKTADAIFFLNATGANWAWDIDAGRFNNSQNTTMNVTFSNANSNLSAPDIYLIFMNWSVIDMNAKAVIQDDKTNVSLTGSFQDVQVPTVSSWWTNDSNANGYIDSIVVTMSETVNNDTGRCGLGWNVSNNVTNQNYSVNTFLSTCDNLTRVNITVTELTVFDTNVTVYVNYTSAIGVIRDITNNNKLGDSNSSALDKARPVLLNATTFDGDEDGYIDAYNLTFSENVSDSSFNWTGETAPALSGANHGLSNVTGTKRNDVFINLNFADGNVSHTTNATPDLTNSFINDTAGNAMLDLASAGLAEYDNASPVFWTVNGYANNFTNRSGKDGWLLNTRFRTNQNISIKFNVSENVTQPTVTVGGNAATLVGTTNTTAGSGLPQVQYEYYYVVQGSETEGSVTLLIRASDLTGKVSMVNTDTNTSQNLTVDYKVTRVPRLTLVDQPQDIGAGLKLNWTAISDDDFFRYSFHCNLTNSSNLAELTAVSTSKTVTDSSFTVKTYHDGTNTTLVDGTEYFCLINVTDSVGNTNTSMNVSSTSYANGNVSLTANKWQMIGTPKYLNNTKFSSTSFSTSDSVKYYNGTDATWYTLGVSTDRMYQLRGYWLYNYDGLQVNTTFRASTGGITPESTTLFTGWNLIGSPTNTAGTNVTTKLNNALGSTKWSIIYFWNVSDSAWYYNTPTGEGDLGSFDVDGGYWVSMTSAGNSTVYTGEP